MSYTSETFMRVYDDDTGEYVEIRPDPDGLGLLEVLRVIPGEAPQTPILLCKEEALLVADAIKTVTNGLPD